MNRVLVYGTLKRGQGLHQYLRKAKYIGVAEVAGMEVYCNGTFPYVCFAPGAKYYEGTRKYIPNPDSDARLIGEVYEVDDPTLHTLDMVEGEGKHYSRVAVEVNGEWTWVYVIDRTYAQTNTTFCPSGWWDDPEDMNPYEYSMDVGYVCSILDYYKSKISELVHPDNQGEVNDYIEDMVEALGVWE